MRNYKLTIQYDGTEYAGWQIQNNAVSVQQKLTEAVETLTREKINLIGSGRTDAGVHALGQVANFRCQNEIDQYKFLYSLNAILPRDISVRGIEEAPESFHARFDARDRSYVYLISKFKTPFYHNYSYFYQHITGYDVIALNELSGVLLGEHDFTSFSKINTEVSNKFCTIHEIRWRDTKDFVIFYVRANRFLHGMVRTIVGTTLFAAEKKLNAGYISELIGAKNREAAQDAAPAKGLFLYKVRY